ncbi:MAG: hypothetical protein ACE5Q6_01485, partial [Dehalococcoidia bacterium]
GNNSTLASFGELTDVEGFDLLRLECAEETDTVTASGETVEASDDATVRIAGCTPPPTIEVTKTPESDFVSDSGDLQMTVEVHNSSTQELTLTSLVDDVHGDLNGKGDCSVPQTIAPGGTYTCQFLFSPQFDSEGSQLWGVDEDDNELFSFDGFLTIYGQLKYDDGSGIVPLDDDMHIGSFGIDIDNHTAYMALNDELEFEGLPDVEAPVLLRFDLDDATTVGDNVVDVVGHIAIPDFDLKKGDNITGLSFSPLTGELYALYRVEDEDEVDRLLILDKTDGSVVSDLGEMTGLGEEVAEGEDLVFVVAPGGIAPVVTDDEDNHLYVVHPGTGAIFEVMDNDQTGGLDGDPSDVKTEALAWFPGSIEEFLAFDDMSDEFLSLTAENGNNSSLFGLNELTDVEGMDITYCGAETDTVTATAEDADGEEVEGSASATVRLILCEN